MILSVEIVLFIIRMSFSAFYWLFIIFLTTNVSHCTSTNTGYGLWGVRWRRIHPRLWCTHWQADSQSSRLLQQCVLYQMNTTATKTLQSVLHSAARLIMRKRKFELITPTLRDDLHWLPVRERIVFKLCSIIFKCRHQIAPQHLQELCVQVTDSTSRRHFRSAARGDLHVLACRYLPLRSFAVWAPKLRNSATVTSWSNT